jgi:hypothetical protein
VAEHEPDWGSLSDSSISVRTYGEMLRLVYGGADHYVKRLLRCHEPSVSEYAPSLIQKT